MKVKLLKLFIAILLLPFCAGGLETLWFLIKTCGTASTVWVPILAGVACWLVIYVLLPEPMLVYVFGHELTHAFWTVVFGGRVKRFKASAKGGHVVVTKDNFVVFLAPYFFPIYAFIIVGAYAIGSIFCDLQKYRGLFHLLLGMAYCFHITFTIKVLQTKQSDILSQGRIFSYTVIALGNLLVLIIALPVLSSFSLITSLKFWAISSLNWYEQIFFVVKEAILKI
ncbi:MAG: hypothetical protein ACP5T0_10735 [Verrucomicrobiia bacterium]